MMYACNNFYLGSSFFLLQSLVLGQDPQNPSEWLDLARAGHVLQAINSISRQQVPVLDLLLFQAFLESTTGNYAGALTTLDRAIEVNVGDSRLSMEHALVLWNAGHYAAAANELRIIQRVSTQPVSEQANLFAQISRLQSILDDLVVVRDARARLRVCTLVTVLSLSCFLLAIWFSLRQTR